MQWGNSQIKANSWYLDIWSFDADSHLLHGFFHWTNFVEMVSICQIHEFICWEIPEMHDYARMNINIGCLIDRKKMNQNRHWSSHDILSHVNTYKNFSRCAVERDRNRSKNWICICCCYFVFAAQTKDRRHRLKLCWINAKKKLLFRSEI